MCMRTAHAIEKAGSQAQLAVLLGITSSAITQWGESVPQARVWQLRVVRPDWFDVASDVQDKKMAPALDGKAFAAINKHAA